ncbi:DUF4190 domain-containing protein [Mycolicibacterium frederiksbergense]|uniref:DUF4190 domain-containing protein n=1 Tax=Mycolicibacterium frederiksbergense TaxID=117567 RepID=UPI00355742FD
MDDPYGESGRSALPPSKFGAGFTVGEDATGPPPSYGYPAQYAPQAPEPPAPDVTRYPPPAPYPVTYAPAAYAPAPSTNSMAIAALVCSLVLAPLGIVFGHIALSQINRTGEEGRGLAIAGLVIGYIFTAIAVLWFVVFAVFLGALTSAVNESTYYDGDYTYSMATTSLDRAVLR